MTENAATYPIGTISALLMLTDRRVQQLTKQGHLPKADHGQYELVPVVQAYIKFLKDRANSNSVDGDGGLDIATERARKAKEEADQLEMKNAQTRRELLARSDVDAAVVGAFARVRSRLIGVPSKVAPLVISLDTPAEAEALVRKAVYEVLRELSDTSIIDLCGDDGDVVEDTGPAAGPDSQPVGGRAAEA